MKNFYSLKVYTLDLTGIEIYEDELDDTKIFRRNASTGEECEIEWDERRLWHGDDIGSLLSQQSEARLHGQDHHRSSKP